MFGEKITKHCPYCKKDVEFNVSIKYINPNNDEVYYNSLICPECESELGDRDKIRKNKCIVIMH